MAVLWSRPTFNFHSLRNAVALEQGGGQIPARAASIPGGPLGAGAEGNPEPGEFRRIGAESPLCFFAEAHRGADPGTVWGYVFRGGREYHGRTDPIPGPPFRNDSQRSPESSGAAHPGRADRPDARRRRVAPLGLGGFLKNLAAEHAARQSRSPLGPLGQKELSKTEKMREPEGERGDVGYDQE